VRSVSATTVDRAARTIIELVTQERSKGPCALKAQVGIFKGLSAVKKAKVHRRLITIKKAYKEDIEKIDGAIWPGLLELRFKVV